jgi:hypothetical protein
VQQGLALVHDNERRGAFSQEEIRVNAFHHAYCMAMGLLKPGILENSNLQLSITES